MAEKDQAGVAVASGGISDIDVAAVEKVLAALRAEADRLQMIARECLLPRIDGFEIALHNRAAEICNEQIATLARSWYAEWQGEI